MPGHTPPIAKGRHDGPQVLPSCFVPCPFPDILIHFRGFGAVFSKHLAPCFPGKELPFPESKGLWPTRHFVPICLVCSGREGQCAARQHSSTPYISPTKLPAHTARSNSHQETIWEPYSCLVLPPGQGNRAGGSAVSSTFQLTTSGTAPFQAAAFATAPAALPFSVESFVLARDRFVELSCTEVSHRDFPFAHGM